MIEHLSHLSNPTIVCDPGPDGYCAICSDEGKPGRVLELLPDNLALVQTDSGQEEVALDLFDNIQIGDHLLIHVGVAIAQLED